MKSFNQNNGLKPKLNWSFRLSVFIGIFLLSFLLFKFVFNSETDFSLYMSLTLSLLQGITLTPGMDAYYVKHHFKNLKKQTSAYIHIWPFFFCHGRIVVLDKKIIFITHKYNIKPNTIELPIGDIKSIQKTKSIISGKSLTISTDDGQSLKFYWVNDIEGLCKSMNSNPE